MTPDTLTAAAPAAAQATPPVGEDKGPVISAARLALILAAAVFTQLMMGFSMFKLVPLQAAIMEFFNIEVSAYGYLNTAQHWLVIVLTVPFGFVIRKLPCKWSMCVCFFIALSGALLQIVTKSYPVFVAGRMLEGCGFGMSGIIVNSLIANLVSRKRVSFWVSVMVLIAIVAQIILTRTVGALTLARGIPFQKIFIGLFVLAVVCFIFWLCVVPRSLRVTGRASSEKPTREQTLRIYKNPSVWFVSLAMICFNMGNTSFSSYVIQYLVTRGMEAGAAATLYSYTSVFAIFAMLAFGWLSDKLRTKRKLAAMSMFAGAVALILLVKLPLSLIMIYVVVFGTLPRSVAGMGNACAPDLAELPADVPVVNSFKNVIGQLGGVAGGILTGYLLQFFGYEPTIYFLSGVMALGGVFWILAKKVP